MIGDSVYRNEMFCRIILLKAKLQDGRKLRRYRRRWKIERTFSWLGNFRRLVVRWDRLITVYRAFFHLACLIITLRQGTGIEPEVQILK